MEDAIEQVVALLPPCRAGPGGEASRSSTCSARSAAARSSIAERLKQLMEQRAVLRDQGLAGERVAARPVRRRSEDGADAREGIRHPAPLPAAASCRPWAVKRLEEFGGDIRKFRVVKRHPSRAASRSAIAKTEPGDENNQDISSLVGKVDIRKLETYAQDDPDAYSYSGGLCLANQGLLEFVEMFKAPIKVLHPLLTATQEGNFKGTEGFGAIPFDGIVLAHSQRERVEDASATTRTTRRSSTASTSSRCRTACACREEVKIYEKLLRNSSLAEAPCAPGTLKMMAQFAVLTRLKEPENSQHLLEDADLRRREPEGHRSASAKTLPGVPRLRRRRRRHDAASRRASPSRSCRRSSTSTRPRSPPTRCT